ncbi:hypothetical protein CJ231_07930 [Hoylesella buccalis]|uniref:Uncharacterized protein n=1 Tax=Hoylesella buccalis TaxID=28127 RepID=A0A2N6QQ19_9BACT|nr:hypothetical protein CJ231_07930 [Hoylesella buccalis]
MQNVSLSSEEPPLWHEAHGCFRYMFYFMAAIISKTKNAMIEGRKDDTQQSKLSLLPFRCVEDAQNTI